MIPEQRTASGELTTKLCAGRINRRTFLERAAAIGLSAAAPFALLESCSDAATTSGPLHLVWQAEYDVSSAYSLLVDEFNRRNQGRIYVTLQTGPDGTTDLFTIERNILKTQGQAVDILSVDIIYIAEFAVHKWLQPISEQRWPLRERDNYMQLPLKACTIDGQLWAVPLRSDVGLMYYRTDLVPRPPDTWEELTSMAQMLLNAKSSPESSPRYGYVWQGAQYEGLVCNFEEVLYGYGGSFFSDPFHPTEVTIDSPEARQALTMMANWIGTISPKDTDTYTEEVARNIWNNRDAIFMRNWPYAYSQSPHLGHAFDVHPMLSGGHNHSGHSALGGWQLAINAFIHPAKQEAAWEFIHYMLEPESQKTGAMVASWAMALQSIYDDQEVLNKVPLFKKLKPILASAALRPVSPNYASISAAIRFYVRQALSGGPGAVSQSMQTLAAALNQIVKSP